MRKTGFKEIMLTAVLLFGGVSAPLSDPLRPAASALVDGDVTAFALHVFAQLQAGQIDRSQLTKEYSAHLADAEVRELAHKLNEYGASPIGAEVMRRHATDDQTLYLVKLLFPRGDAAAMLLGLNADGKITGVSMLSMAGD